MLIKYLKCTWFDVLKQDIFYNWQKESFNQFRNMFKVCFVSLCPLLRIVRHECIQPNSESSLFCSFKAQIFQPLMQIITHTLSVGSMQYRWPRHHHCQFPCELEKFQNLWKLCLQGKLFHLLGAYLSRMVYKHLLQLKMWP